MPSATAAEPDGPAVTVASVGVPVDRFKVRPVQDWRAYNVNASERHTLEELSRARQEHDAESADWGCP